MPSVKCTCPICGYPDLDEPAYNSSGSPSFDICSCCGVQFGYNDTRWTHDELRDCWIKLGMSWWSPLPKPQGWDPIKQMKAAGLWSPLLPQDLE